MVTKDSRPNEAFTKALFNFLETTVDALPTEFWLHLGRGLQELGKALEILAEHGRVSATPVNEWLQLYETIMQREPRVGCAQEEIGD